MKGYMNGGPDVLETRMIGDAMGQEMQVSIIDKLGLSPLAHTWVPTRQVVTDMQNGQYRIWNYAGKVYRDQAVRPRAEDKRKAELRLKWWEIEDHMKDLGVHIELRVVPAYSYVEASIDMWEGNDCLPIDSQEVDTD